MLPVRGAGPGADQGDGTLGGLSEVRGPADREPERTPAPPALLTGVGEDLDLLGPLVVAGDHEAGSGRLSTLQIALRPYVGQPCGPPGDLWGTGLQQLPDLDGRQPLEGIQGSWITWLDHPG